MDPIPELVPISEIRKRQSEILVQLHDNSVILTQRDRAAAVLVSPEQWNRLIVRLKELEQALEEMLDVRAVREIEARISAGEEPVLDWVDVEAELDAASP